MSESIWAEGTVEVPRSEWNEMRAALTAALARAEAAEAEAAKWSEEGQRQLVRAEAAERERDEAVAHDRQPYPTAWAYEQACAALVRVRSELDRALSRQRRVGETLKEAMDVLDNQPDATHAEMARRNVRAWRLLRALAAELSEEEA